jgi:Lrp/AsnC family transcriptional regulator for asnA, asnC and gidA
MKSASESGYHLDGVDKEIIYMLMDNAKTSLAHISKMLGFLQRQFIKESKN